MEIRLRCIAGKTFRLRAGLLVLLLVPAAWKSAAGADNLLNAAGAAHYSRNHGGTVLIITRKGVPDAAFYEPGYQPRSAVPVFSITKSLTALTCISLRHPSLETTVLAARGKEAVSLHQLLSQTSGISPGYEKLYKKNLSDVRKAATSLPVESSPGDRFAYGPSHYELVGMALNPADASPDSARQLIAGFLLKLGIRPLDWRTDRRGHIYLSAGVILTPEDLLKIGRFVLACGKGSGASNAKFKPAFTGSQANPAYGLGFWLNRAAGNARPRDIEDAIGSHLMREDWNRMCLSNLAPRDLICMAGSGGQRVYVIPSLDAVIVRLGRPSKFTDPGFLQALFSSKVR
jgi:CubicO group peptidase (beta-lactamase class C family)